MPKQNQRKPTAAELEILAVLWEKDAATVKEVHEVINQRKPTGYTTVLKTMQIMREKNLVERNDANKAHVFKAVEAQSETQKSLVTDLIEKVFRGSALKLVQHVLEAKPSSADELKKIRKLIREAEKRGEQK
ncbi:MAG: BlaI/MecI/CopY family transcriptional regulator [Acidobacteriota bacterium]|jgi:predicted transcriptional regulator|nr:BlaI/MecI/CopY family transcriptional regulator [Acidobacteriota bacterium]MDQ3372477.1 BlaI/MecI/CopY family transcriptional regulator [Acidobacteriota bacterium]